MTRDQWEIPRGIRGFMCGANIVLYRESTGDLFLLNDTAAFAWQALTSGQTPHAVAQTIADSTNAPPECVAEDLSALLDEWDALAEPPPTAARGTTLQLPAPSTAPRAAARSSYDAREPCYRLLDMTFSVRAESPSDLDVVSALFGHLRAPASAHAVVFDVLRGADGKISLVENGRLLGECNADDELAPLLHAEILMAAYVRADCFAGLHAAVVVHDGRAILMPARSGDGKSTLTAALVAAGFRYGTDDLAILTPPPLQVRAVPEAIGLKEGSWQPLAERLPTLRERDVHMRSDRRRIRYFVPPVERIAPSGESYPTAALLFPTYVRGASMSCDRIRPGEALLRLTQAGYDARLSAPVVEALTEWIGGVPAYALRYADLDEAVAAVGKIV